MSYEIVPATLALAAEMAPRLRTPDLEEVTASHGQTAMDVLSSSLGLSLEAWALLIDGTPAAIWGVQPICRPARVGLVWMLGTESISSHRLLFWKLCRREVERLMREWSVLFNWIDARYGASLRWAERLGFLVDEPRPYGRSGAPFCCAALTTR